MSDVQLQLLHDRILVKPEPLVKTTPGGLELPESAADISQSPFRVGTVCSVGPGMILENTIQNPGIGEVSYLRTLIEVNVGDRVVHHMRAGDTLFVNGEKFLLMGNRDVTAVIGPDVTISQLHVSASG